MWYYNSLREFLSLFERFCKFIKITRHFHFLLDNLAKLGLISINFIFKPDTTVNVAVLLEGTGSAWDILGSYNSTISGLNPRYANTSLTYFWVHQISA